MTSWVRIRMIDCLFQGHLCTCTGVVPNTLVLSRKQGTTETCKICGGSPVDGIGSLSASMISAKGLELTNFINPHLTWTVSKGYKRSTRRSRKQTDRSLKFDADLADKGAENPLDTTVSESEKLGVAVLGRRFSDSIEHVPIKKRRFMVLSPSPPHPCHEDKEQLMNGPYSSDKLSCPKLTSKKQVVATDASKVTRFRHGAGDRAVNGYLSEEMNENCGYSDDFSGIEILAAAACNNSVNDDCNHAEEFPSVEESVQERRDKSNTATPVKKSSESLEKTSSSTLDAVNQGTMDGLSIQGNDAEIQPKDDTTTEKSVSSRDVRFHWDLNVAIDAWEQPCDSVVMNPQTSTVEDVQSGKLEVLEANKIQKEPSNTKIDIGSLVEPTFENEENRLEGSAVTDRNNDKCVPTDKPLEFSACDVKDVEAPSQNIDANDSSCPASIIIEGSVLEENKETSPASLVTTKTVDDISLGMQDEKMNCSEEKPNVFPCASVGPAHEVNEECEVPASSLHDELKSPQEMMTADGCHTSVTGSVEVKPVDKAEEAIVNNSELNCDDVCLSGVSTVDGQSLATVNVEEQVEEASMAHTDNPDEVVHESSGNSKRNVETGVGCTSGEVCQKYGDSSRTSWGRATIGDTYDESYDIDVCDKNDTVGNENTRDFEAGYDSQYEDGELRESDVHWEDNDCEAECVDYGSDMCENDDADYLSGKAECADEEFARKKSSPVYNVFERIEHGAAGEALKQSSAGSKSRTSGSDQLLGGSETSSNRVGEMNEGFIARKHVTDCLDGFDDKDSSAKVVCSRTSRKEFPCIEGQRNRGSSNFEFSSQHETGSDLSMGKERSDMQMHGKSLGGANLANGSLTCWDSKRRLSPTCHGSFGSGRPRPRSVIESRGYTAGIGGGDNHTHRQALNSSSNGFYRPPLRRRSPVSRDDTHNMHRGMAPMRDTSPDRRRFRRYPQGVGRAFREEYHRPMPNDSDEYSYHVPHRMPRREQNGSPPSRGPIYYKRPYKRSQSRSRSRSPVSGWLLQRDRDEVPKHRCSRSPDYRFEARMERMRLPFQKQGFAAKYEEFLSPQRRRFSPPQHNSRWFDDPNNGIDHFRGRRLTGRFQQNQRFDSVGSSRRLNSDDYFEPMIRPGRFPEMGRGGRLRRYDGSDDERRKHEIIHRVRRYDSDGVVRRFRYDEDDCFVSRNAHNYNECDNSDGAERRPRNMYLGEVAKKKVSS